MNKILRLGLVALLLESCTPDVYRPNENIDDATNFTYQTKGRIFHATILDNSCEKPCRILIDEYQKSSNKDEFILSATWILENYGNRAPYDVKRYNHSTKAVQNLDEKDLNNRAIPIDTLKSRFHY